MEYVSLSMLFKYIRLLIVVVGGLLIYFSWLLGKMQDRINDLEEDIEKLKKST